MSQMSQNNFWLEAFRTSRQIFVVKYLHLLICAYVKYANILRVILASQNHQKLYPKIIFM